MPLTSNQRQQAPRESGVKLGLSFKNERKQRGLRQAEVAEVMGMHQPAYARIESPNGRAPTKQQQASFRLAMRMYDLGQWPELLKGAP